MRLEGLSKPTVLATAAHPDDIDFGAGGTIAKLVKEGAQVFYLICTNGNKGSSNRQMTARRLATIRCHEQLAAAQVLGVNQVFFLNYNDGELEPTLDLKRDIVRVIRQTKPNIVITMDPVMRYSEKIGYINHPDHIAAAEATLAAVFPLARDHLSFPEHTKQGLDSHKVDEVWLINFEDYNCTVDISNTIEQKLAALKCHQSQFSNEAELVKIVRGFARTSGKKNGFKYAESFKRIVLSF